VDLLGQIMYLGVRILDIHNSKLYLECNIDTSVLHVCT